MPDSWQGVAEMVEVGGEEKTVFQIPRGYGYAYKASDTWLLNQMIRRFLNRRQNPSPDC